MLEVADPFLGVEDLLFILLELGREEPLGADERLLAHVIGRDLGQVGLGHLDVIAEDLVVADLERADAGPLALPLLQLGDEGLAGAADRAQVVELGVPAVLDDPAFGQQEGRLVEDGPVDERGDVLGRCPSGRTSPGTGRPRRPGARARVAGSGARDLLRATRSRGWAAAREILPASRSRSRTPLSVSRSSRRAMVAPRPSPTASSRAAIAADVAEGPEEPGAEQPAARGPSR